MRSGTKPALLVAVSFLMLALTGAWLQFEKSIGEPRTRKCGVYRAEVKAASDRDAMKIITTPAESEVARLAAATPSPPVPGDFRAGIELTVFRVKGALRSVRFEPDGDIHLIIEDGNRTLIAEVPSLDCGAEHGRFAAEIRSARSYLLERRHRLVRSHASVTVDGVAFVDFEHGQSGAAGNSVELHPVVRICSGIDCLWR